jgi:hypothetical protein
MATANTKRNVSKDYSDLYSTPQEALKALCKVVEFNPSLTYFEPCNGIGGVSEFFKDTLRIPMVTNELHGHMDSDYKEDYLNPSEDVKELWGFDVIVSNPPYKIAKEFILEGFRYSKVQFHLLRLNFIEGKARKEELFSLGHLKRIYVFSYRISCPKGVDMEPQANAVAYAWYEFDRDYQGNPEIIWL